MKEFLQDLIRELNIETITGFFVRMGTVIIILIITFLFQAIVKRLFNKYISRASEKLNTDPTKYNFLKHFTSAVIIMVGIGLAIYSIPGLKTLSVSLFAGAGVLAAIIGFASQAAFSNIISGIFIVLFKPFKIGDRILIGETHSGVVEDISLRHTVIRNFENKRIVIPNHIISEQTIVNSNLEDEKICKFLEFGISYDSDVDKAMTIIREEAENHPLCLDMRTQEQLDNHEHKVIVRLVNFGDSSVNLRGYAWAPDPVSAWIMGTELNLSIKKRFDNEGIEIPFPYRTIVFKDPNVFKKGNEQVDPPSA